MSDTADDSFTLPLSLTAADYARYFDLFGQRQKEGLTTSTPYLLALVSTAPVAVILGQWVFPAMERRDGWAVGLLCLAAALFGMLAMFLAMRFAHARLLNGLAEAAVKEWDLKLVIIDTQGVRAVGDFISTHARWPAIDAVSLDDGVTLWTGRSNGIRIPEHAFASPSQREALVNYARAQMAAVRPASPVT